MIGALFGLVAPWTHAGALLGAGLVYGAIWWVLGARLIMPAGLGMPVFQVDQMAMMSPIGHLIYGVVTGAVLYGFRRRQAHI